MNIEMLSPEDNGWMPISQAPEQGEWALVYADGAMNCAWVQRGKLPEDWTNPENPNVFPQYVTHYHPLPPPPTKELT